MSEAIDLNQYDDPDPDILPEPDEAFWPKPDLRIVESPPEVPDVDADEAFIRALVAKGEVVISYKTAHRQPNGRPRRFGPTYPL